MAGVTTKTGMCVHAKIIRSWCQRLLGVAGGGGEDTGQEREKGGRQGVRQGVVGVRMERGFHPPQRTQERSAHRPSRGHGAHCGTVVVVLLSPLSLDGASASFSTQCARQPLPTDWRAGCRRGYTWSCAVTSEEGVREG